MVEETIRSIRETEKKADEIVRSAEEKSRETAEATKEQALRTADQIIKDARGQAAEVSVHAKQAGDRAEANALAETEKEVEALKASALGREKEAVELVISLLA